MLLIFKEEINKFKFWKVFGMELKSKELKVRKILVIKALHHNKKEYLGNKVQEVCLKVSKKTKAKVLQSLPTI